MTLSQVVKTAVALSGPGAPLVLGTMALAKNGAFSHRTIERMAYDMLNERHEYGEFKVKKLGTEKSITELAQKMEKDPEPGKDYIRIGGVDINYIVDVNSKYVSKNMSKEINRLCKREKLRSNDPDKITKMYHRLHDMAKRSERMLNYMYFRLGSYNLIKEGVEGVSFEPIYTEFSHEDQVFINTVAEYSIKGLKAAMFPLVEVGNIEDYLVENEEHEWTKNVILDRETLEKFKEFINDRVKGYQIQENGIPILEFVDKDNLDENKYARTFTGEILQRPMYFINKKDTPKKQHENVVSEETVKAHEYKPVDINKIKKDSETKKFNYMDYKFPKDFKLGGIPEKEARIILGTLCQIYKGQGYSFGLITRGSLDGVATFAVKTSKNGKECSTYNVDTGHFYGGERLSILTSRSNLIIPVDVARSPELARKVLENNNYTLTDEEMKEALKFYPVNVEAFNHVNFEDTKFINDLSNDELEKFYAMLEWELRMINSNLGGVPVGLKITAFTDATNFSLFREDGFLFDMRDGKYFNKSAVNMQALQSQQTVQPQFFQNQQPMMQQGFQRPFNATIQQQQSQQMSEDIARSMFSGGWGIPSIPNFQQNLKPLEETINASSGLIKSVDPANEQPAQQNTTGNNITVADGLSYEDFCKILNAPISNETLSAISAKYPGYMVKFQEDSSKRM